MRRSRVAGVLCLAAGAAILVSQVVERTSGALVQTHPLVRESNWVTFVAAPFRLPAESGGAELFVVVERNLPFQHDQPFAPPILQILDAGRAVVDEREGRLLHTRSRPAGRTRFYTAGVFRSETPEPLSARVTFAEDLVSSPRTQAWLELRRPTEPAWPVSALGGTLFSLGVALLFLTRPGRA